MKSQITIPIGAECCCSNYGELAYHVIFDTHKSVFEEFCTANNIGYHEGARRDVTKSDKHIFTTDKSVFKNFPEEVE